MRSSDWNADAPPPSTSTTTPPPPSLPPSPPPPSGALLRRRRLAGLACVATVALVWAGASFVVAGVEAAGLPPLALTYIANSLFVLYLPFYCCLRARRRRKGKQSRGSRQSNGMPLDEL
jgi:hypothetical protein